MNEPGRPHNSRQIVHYRVAAEARLRLTRQEFSLLRMLALHAGRAVTHQQLLIEIWGTTHVNEPQYLRVLVRRVRGRIEKDPANPQILTAASGIG